MQRSTNTNRTTTNNRPTPAASKVNQNSSNQVAEREIFDPAKHLNAGKDSIVKTGSSKDKPVTTAKQGTFNQATISKQQTIQTRDPETVKAEMQKTLASIKPKISLADTMPKRDSSRIARYHRSMSQTKRPPNIKKPEYKKPAPKIPENDHRNEQYERQEDFDDNYQHVDHNEFIDEERSHTKPNNRPVIPRNREEGGKIAELRDLKRIIVKLELGSSPIYEFLYSLLLDMKNVKKGINKAELEHLVDEKLSNILSENEKILLVKTMDNSANGNIDVNEIKTFALNMAKSSKEQVLSFGLITVMLARSLEFEGTSTNKFLMSKNISPDKIYPLDDFVKAMGAAFEIEIDDGREIFAQLDFKNTGVCDLNTFIKKVDSYRGDLDKYKNEVLTKPMTDQVKKEVDGKPKPKAKGEDSKEKEDVNAVKKIIVLMEIADKPIDTLFEFILREMKDYKAGMPMTAIANKLNSDWSTAIGEPDVQNLLKELDGDKSGSINLKEIQAFILKWTNLSKEKILSLTVLLMMLAKDLQVQNTATEKFLQTGGLDPTKTALPINSLTALISNHYELSVELVKGLMAEMDNGSGSVDTRLFIARFDGYRGGQSSTSQTDIKRQKDEWNIERLRNAIRAKGQEPMSIFEKACNPGQNYTTVAAISTILRIIVPDFPKAELTNSLQTMDADKNGFVNRDEFRMMFLDEKSLDNTTDNKTKTNKPVITASDNAILEKFKENLKQINVAPEKFFELVDKNKDDIINLVEFKNAITQELPRSQLAAADIAKLMKIMDLNGNREIDKEEFLTTMGKIETVAKKDTTKPDKGGSKSGTLSNSKLVGKPLIDPQTQADADKLFDQLMEKYQITPQDYFANGEKKWNTIFNNQIAALKFCQLTIKKLEAAKKKQWDDPEFGPTPDDEHGTKSMYYKDPLPNYPDPEVIEWCRPSEISTTKAPEFLDDGASSNDVVQGEIGDCWLIGGISVLATDDTYIRGNFVPTPEAIQEITDEEADNMTKGVYPPIFHFLRKYGIFVMRFFKNYEWRYVVMDDKLPCRKQEECPPELVFGKCKNVHEFWVPLIEKAYAKLHNCYEALITGYLDDAITDMTGLVSEKIQVQGPKGFPGPGIESADALWKKLKDFNASGTMLGCSVAGGEGETEHQVEIDGENVGILKGHAYSILEVLEIPNPASKKPHKSHRLIRVRNPWGNLEWTGKWSDGSPVLMENLKKLNEAIQHRANTNQDFEVFDPEANDGTFLMCFKDWRSIYNRLFASINFPPEWSGIRYIDEWNKDNSGGSPAQKNPETFKQWAKNPQFLMKLKKNGPTKIFISLGQPDGRLLHGLKFPFKENIHPACVAVLKLDDGESKATAFDPKKAVKVSIMKDYRETSMELDLNPGTYAVVPCTQEKGQFGKFFLNIYYDCTHEQIEASKVDSNLKWNLIAEEEETVNHCDDNIKLILKLKANAVIFSDDMDVMGSVKPGAKVITAPSKTDKDKEESKDSAKNTSKSVGKDVGKDAGKGTVKDTGKDTGKGTARDTGKGTAKTSAQDDDKSLNKTPAKKSDEPVKEVNISPEEGQKRFDAYLSKIILGPKDYFRDKKTIVNSYQAALKVTDDLVKQLKAQNKTKWDDPYFGPKNPQDAGMSYLFLDRLPPNIKENMIRWCRPEEISPKNTTFLDHGATSSDVCQGCVGDCWFISAVAIIGAHDVYLQGRYDPSPAAVQKMSDDEAKGMMSGIYCPIFHFLREYGIYVMRFFKDYGWRYVIIDDKLPCVNFENAPPQLLFASCRSENEFWVPILEKAYAKIYNGYGAIEGGFTNEALSDMTSHVCNQLDIPNDDGNIETFWNSLKDFVKNDTLLGCTVPAPANEMEHELLVDGKKVGIIKNHAYSLLDVLEIPNPAAKNKHKTHRLLRVRNPWGKYEWNGAWADGSDKLMNNIEKINKYIQNEVNKDDEYEPFDPKADDGTFLINYKNFRHIYRELYMCMDFPPDWSGVRIFDGWTTETAGSINDPDTFKRNPQFRVDINAPKGRLVEGSKYPFSETIHPCCFTMLKLDSGETKAEWPDRKKMVAMSKLNYYRENSSSCEVENGSYVIVLSCQKNEISIKKVDGEIKMEQIVREHEKTDVHFDDAIKVFLKMKANQMISK